MRFRLASLVPTLSLAALLAAGACNSESEGYPCDPRNGNNDCNDGLACVATPNTRATNAADVCCPVAPATPTTSECSQSTLVDAGNPSVPEASTSSEASTSRDSGGGPSSGDGGSSDAPSSHDGGGSADGGPG